MKINLPDMRRRLFYDVGLSMNEQRWLFEKLTGYPAISHRRCPDCDTSGCAKCEWRGFVVLPAEAVEVPVARWIGERIVNEERNT